MPANSASSRAKLRCRAAANWERALPEAGRAAGAAATATVGAATGWGWGPAAGLAGSGEAGEGGAEGGLVLDEDDIFCDGTCEHAEYHKSSAAEGRKALRLCVHAEAACGASRGLRVPAPWSSHAPSPPPISQHASPAGRFGGRGGRARGQAACPAERPRNPDPRACGPAAQTRQPWAQPIRSLRSQGPHARPQRWAAPALRVGGYDSPIGSRRGQPGRRHVGRCGPARRQRQVRGELLGGGETQFRKGSAGGAGTLAAASLSSCIHFPLWWPQIC